LLHKPTKMEAESQPPVPEPQIPPRISFSPLMQNCTPSKIASPYLDWVRSGSIADVPEIPATVRF
jgi:hypothetical protein